MAAIDKTYISSFEDYKRVSDWIGNRSITFKNGNAIKLISCRCGFVSCLQFKCIVK